MRRTLLVLLCALAVVAMAAPARADITLADYNSTALISPTSTSGMYGWAVDGVNQMYQQWFWYRIGATGGEAAINTIGAPTVSQFAPNIAQLSYAGNGFTIDVLYTLYGGSVGSGSSDIAETIRIRNTGTTSLDFHFFQYSDFDLNGTIGGQTVQMVNANTVEQFGAGVEFSETVATPPPAYHQVDLYNNLLVALGDGSPTTLNNVNGPVTGDATWAFQWDFSIGAGSSVSISKDKNLRPIPEPGSMLLLGSGLIGLAGAVRRRLKK